ncbi:MAG: insulinase family protein [Clostridia bacterium]|nr:insulinase family protein [Clostridia bacterium]
MNYNKKNIKEGITLHKINTTKFKTNLFAIFVTTPLTRENVTKNALISAVLRRGTNNYKSQDIISKELENMYGASFDCGIDKNGDNQVLKFYVESINDEYLPENYNLAQKSLNLLADIVFNPLVQNGAFNRDYVNVEKNTLKQIIEGKIDNKARYAFDRCIEEMYKNEPYGLYKFGYVEDLESITEVDLYNHYKDLMANAKIDVFVSGFNTDNINENEILADLNDRQANYIKNTNKHIENKLEKPNEIIEKMDVTQGKLIIGTDIIKLDESQRFAASVYSVILGGGANSKLFQNVREKASLAYSAGASYIKVKNNITIKCGIEINNYEKALNIIKEQLDQMVNGNFSDNDIKSAKQLIFASLNSIDETQDGEINYYFSQELSERFVDIEEYKKGIQEVTKEQIIDIAKKININTIYFLTGNNA